MHISHISKYLNFFFKKFFCFRYTLYICANKNKNDMKNEIIYRNRTIIENTDGTFSAFYSNYSSHLVKTFKTLAAAKKQIDKWG